MSEHTAPLPAVEPEPKQPRSKFGVIAVVASVVAVVLVAGGGFAAWRLLAGSGPRPAEVLPASTFAVLSVDLDPSGGQKIEAIQTLRKFPSFRENTGVRPDSDVIKEIWDDTVAEECDDVDYAKDVEPWIGKRLALGGVELDKGKPLPVLAVQVSDADAADKGFAKLEDCANESGDDEFGYAVGDEYVLVSDSPANAKAILAAGKKSSLAEDGSYQEWTEEAGGPGIVNGYVSKRGGEMLQEELGGDLEDMGPEANEQLDKALKSFKGAGMALRFADGGLELSFAAGGDTSQVGDRNVGDHVQELPKDTAALAAGAVDGKKLGDQLEETFEGLGELFGGFTGEDGDPLEMLEEETGLRLPDDLVTLLGDSFSLSVGGDAPADLNDVAEPADLPIGYLVRGDEAAVKDVIDRVEERTGASLEELPATFDTGDGKAVVASNPDYAKQLLDNGSLGDDEAFQDVVPEAGKSPFVFYLSLNNDWSESLSKAARESGDESAEEIAGDIKAVKAFGFSAWADGDTGHALMRLTVK